MKYILGGDSTFFLKKRQDLCDSLRRRGLQPRDTNFKLDRAGCKRTRNNKQRGASKKRLQVDRILNGSSLITPTSNAQRPKTQNHQPKDPRPTSTTAQQHTAKASQESRTLKPTDNAYTLTIF
jgi:hypothetical protein